MKSFYSKLGLLALTLFLLPYISNAQRRNKVTPVKTEYPQELYSSLEYRSIGPHRGGRSAAVTGVPGETNLFYFGATGGGVGRLWMVAALGKIFPMDILAGVSVL